MSSQETSIVVPSNFDIGKVSHSNVAESTHQFTSYPKYNNGDFVFQLSETRLINYGIPISNGAPDHMRSYIKLPLDSTQPNCVSVYDMLKKLDQWIANNYKNIIGNNNASYKIYPLVTEPNAEHGGGHPFCMLKFNLAYISKAIITSCFLTKNGSRQPMESPKLPDIHLLLKRGSIFKALVHVNKIWFGKTQIDGAKGCGIKLTLLQLDIIQKTKARIPIQLRFTEYKMIDTDTNATESIEI